VWVLVLLLAGAGCEGERGGSGTQVSAKPKVELRETLRKTTQRVYDLKEELAKGAVETSAQITGYDPISGPGQAYVKVTGQLGTMAVQQALEMYKATNDRYPRSLDEFKTEVLKAGLPDGIQLPERPFYQEYAYDTDNHRLVVIEYPERKAQFEAQQRAERGQ
jgi:hypothetical protein